METVDSKITNFSILATKKLNNIKAVDEFKIEGFQNFQQYLKINQINIQITHPEIQNKLLFYANRYKYRFIANSLLFSSSIKKDTNVILPVTRRNQVAGQLPRKAYASVTYSDKNIRIYFRKCCKYLYELQFYENSFTNSIY